MFRLDRFLTLFFFRLFSGNSRQHKVKVPILMYHSISDDPEKGMSPYYRVTTSPPRFRQHMEWLNREGYSVIDLAEALQKMDESMPEQKRFVVLTFDDGFRDFLLNAWPVLKNFGYPATVYLTTNYVGEARKAFKGRECLTWEEVRKLHTQGTFFGSHTVNHPTLYGLTWEEIRRELAESREKLEKELQAPISRFSYPYAFPQEDQGFVRRFLEELRDTGYATAVTTAIGQARKGSDSFCLPRLPVNELDDQKLFDAKLCGYYDWMTTPQAALRYIKSKFLRNRKYNCWSF